MKSYLRSTHSRNRGGRRGSVFEILVVRIRARCNPSNCVRAAASREEDLKLDTTATSVVHCSKSNERQSEVAAGRDSLAMSQCHLPFLRKLRRFVPLSFTLNRSGRATGDHNLSSGHQTVASPRAGQTCRRRRHRTPFSLISVRSR